MIYETEIVFAKMKFGKFHIWFAMAIWKLLKREAGESYS